MNLGDQPAFPEIRIKQVGDPAYCQPTRVYYPGMSTRTWLAGMATIDEGDWPNSMRNLELVMGRPCPDYAGKPIEHLAYRLEFEAKIKVAKADALLAELEKEKP